MKARIRASTEISQMNHDDGYLGTALNDSEGYLQWITCSECSNIFRANIISMDKISEKDLENMRLLCKRCHHHETKHLETKHLETKHLVA